MRATRLHPAARGLTALCVGAVQILAQAAPAATPPVSLDDGRRFVALLRLHPQDDTPLFASAGFDRAAALLQAVLDQGQQPSASPADWKNLHRAADGLIELCVLRGETYQASTYALLQQNFYRNLEGDYAAALEAARRSLALQERSGISATLYLAHSAIGRDLAALGRNQEALPEYQAARQLDPDPKNPSAAQRWRDLIQAEIALGDTAAAGSEVAAIGQAAPSIGGLYRARALLARADFDLAASRFHQAVDDVVEAQSYVPAADGQTFAAEAVYELGACILAIVDQASYSDAIALADHIQASVHGLPINLAAFAQQAVQARRRIAGDLDGVLRDDSLRLEEARRDNHVPAQVEALRSMAVTYQALHARSQRVSVLEQALALEKAQLPASAPPAYPAAFSLVTTLNNLGSAYLDLEDPRAERAFRSSVELISSLPAADSKRLESFASEARVGLARAAEIDSDPDTARDILSAESQRHPDSPTAALAWARLERNLGEQPRQAAGLYGQAASLFHAQNALQPELTVRLELARFLATGAAAKIDGAHDQARSQLDTVAAAAHAFDDAEIAWQLPYTQGLVAEAEGRRDAAIAAYRDAVARLESLRSGIADSSLRQAFADSKLTQDLYSRLISLYAGRKLAANAWEYLEREKARAFVEMLAGHRAAEPPAATPEWDEVRRIESQIASLRADLSGPSQVILRGSGRSPATLRAQLQSLQSAYSVARERAQATGPVRPLAPGAPPVTLERIRARLPRRTALVEFAILPGQLAAFVATRDGIQLRSWPANPDVLKRKVLGLRRALESPDSGAQLDQATADLSQLVLAPIAGHIPASIDCLIVVLAGPLYQIPFETLQLSKGEYLLDRFTISYLPSAAALAAPAPQSKAAGSLLLGAIGGQSVQGMPGLPGTLRETAAIAAIEPGARVVSQTAFTHDTALAALNVFDRVHFATHGILDEDAPLFSALLTSPAAGQPARISLYEIAATPVHSRLVVLSACETGLGRLSGGDEMVGLTRTFLAAGARVVVSSLWKVSDESTAALMQEFYRGLKCGKPPAAAMRAAELKIRKQYPHPFYWAPFVVTGAILKFER